MPERFVNPDEIMMRAIQLAQQGAGLVEPNPMVGAVIVDEALRLIAEGFHEKSGGPHAEVNAINSARRSGESCKLHHATLYVTLEPCAHYGKTPPCTDAVINAGFRKVVIGCKDPASHEMGNGIQRLKDAGIDVEVGVLQFECEKLIRPFTKLMTEAIPYIHAKWAMTLDGKIATSTGASQWISNEDSRQIVHQLRGRMDAILVGSGTVRADDPLLTARPPGKRIATRIVLDSNAAIPFDSKLVQSASETPLIVACLEDSPSRNRDLLTRAGVEVLLCPADEQNRPRLDFLLRELGSRKMTNLLLEGGSGVLGTFFDLNLVDEVHAFIAPKIVGGDRSPGPIAGAGVAQMSEALKFQETKVTSVNGDIYVNGWL